MNDIAKFYTALKDSDQLADQIKKAKNKLRSALDNLVSYCPHSEACDVSSSLRGVGTFRICKICGLIDRASQGGTPGNEYEYGYAGHPNHQFWSHATITKVDDKEWDSYRRDHNWHVKNGKVVQ